jgi:Amt family ammonium transporter
LGLRVTEEEEYEGLDLSECGMEAYPEFVQH